MNKHRATTTAVLVFLSMGAALFAEHGGVFGGKTDHTLFFPHFGNGDSIRSELVLVNASGSPTRAAIHFYDKGGETIPAESVVDVTADLEARSDGGLSTTPIEPNGEITVPTNGLGETVRGSVRVVSKNRIGGFLRFVMPGIGVAGVASSEPAYDVIVPVRRESEGVNTGLAVNNLGAESSTVECRLMKNGKLLETMPIDLEANGQESKFIHEIFTETDTSDFTGSVRCAVPEPGEGRLTGLALEFDAENGIITTLPVIVIPTAPRGIYD